MNKFKKLNIMKIKLLLLLLSSLSYAFASDTNNILSSAYNSVSFSISSATGDLEGSGTSTTFSIKPFNQNFIFQYSLSSVDIDEILGLSVFGVDADNDSFQLGYLIEGDDNSHIIPFISLSALEYSFQGYGIEADATSFGFLYRVLASESSVWTFGFAYVDYDDVLIPSSTRTAINNELSNLGYGNYSSSEFDAIESDSLSSNTLFTLNLDMDWTESFMMRYGIATDFDTTTFSLGGAFKF
jgi:hypothetical protein